MPITLSGYGENKGKNLLVISLVIAVGILLTKFGISVIMGLNRLLWFQGGLLWGISALGEVCLEFDKVELR